MEGTGRHWYAREEVQKVTSDWVQMNCKLTEREEEILRLVHERKLVRRDHLEVISESYRELGDNRTRLMNRAIKKMFKNMCLDKVHEKQEIGKGNSPSIVGLDRAGSMILDIPHKARIIQKKTLFNGRWYIKRYLPANYKHINGVNQMEVDTISFCQDTESEIVKWEIEKGKEFYYGGEKIHVIPDVFTELKIRGKSLLLYLEYDTGSENFRHKNNFPIIHEKILKYRKYQLSKLWETRYSSFPILLLVTEDDKRISYFNKKCKELGMVGFGVYYENYTKFLKQLANMI